MLIKSIKINLAMVFVLVFSMFFSTSASTFAIDNEESCVVEESYDVYAGQHNDIGDVDVTMDSEEITLAFTLVGGWRATSYHVYVLDYLPDSRPAPGQAPYKGDLDNESNFSITVPTGYEEGTDIYILAHLDTNKSGPDGGNETAYAGTITGKWFGYINLTVPVCEDPEDPQDPEDPEDPQDPEDPEDPEDPQDPEDPKDPVDPEDPQDPEDPEDPQDPEDPEDPQDPEDPEDPQDPEDPEDPEDPQDPEDPEDPQDPEDPEDPQDPEDPEDPEDPVDPQDPEDDEEIIVEEEETPLGEPEIEDKVISAVEEVENVENVEEVKDVEEEIFIEDEPIPTGLPNTLPQTGETIPFLEYIAGSLLVILGVFLRRFK